MKFAFSLLVGLLPALSSALTNGKGDVTCFFLYQAADGSFPKFEDRSHMVQWGKPGTYLLHYAALQASVEVETEIRTTPFDHAFMKITYTDSARGLAFSSRGRLTPTDESHNQANLILETSISPLDVNGVSCEKFIVSCVLTN